MSFMNKDKRRNPRTLPYEEPRPEKTGKQLNTILYYIKSTITIHSIDMFCYMERIRVK